MKISTLALLIGLPAGLAAQTPAAPPANPVTTAFRTRIAALERNIGQAFDSIPGDKYGYKPTLAQQTIGFIAQHIASDNYLFCNAFGDKKAMRAAEDTSTADSVKATWPKDKLVGKLKESLNFCSDAITQLDDTKLGEQTTLMFRNGPRQVSRAAMVLGHALDLADHYSQIANYMRLNGLLPPTALPRPRPASGN
jgi:uncharacterized damage-inducible protein DinB